MVAGLHQEFVHAGSDVVEAFTYYAHREKMRIIGKEHLIEPLNRAALTIARDVADEHGCLAAGDLSNTNAFYPDAATRAEVRKMFEEQVGWIVDAGMDYCVAETFSWGEEALLALEVIKEAGLTAVVTLSIHRQGEVREGWSPEDTCARLEQAGADVVGLNCIRGPRTMLPLVARIRETVDCHVAALPVPYRTTDAEPSFQSLTDPGCDCLPDDRPFPTALDPLLCNRYEIAQFGREAYDLGIRYLGVCCGAAPHMIRSMAEALGRETPASRYSPDMSRHPFLGTHDQLRAHNQQYAKEL
jgi:betaine-homocysteine S-methyltransferase